MKHAREEVLMRQVSIDPIAVDLGVLVINETKGLKRDKAQESILWLMRAGLKPHQAIRATTLARFRLGIEDN